MRILFSITAHESIIALNDLVESILYAYTNSYGIVHINQSWSDFSDKDIIHINDRVFINPNRFILSHSLSGKTGLHVSNMEYFNSLDIDYDYIVFTASNELFLKKIPDNYFVENQYGSDFLSVTKSSKYYEKIPHIDADFINGVVNHISAQLNSIGEKNGIFGGRHEGMFFNKDLGIQMIYTYRKFFGDSIDLCRCDEEIIPHTILYNSAEPTDTESICYFHNQNFNIDTIINFKKLNFLEKTDLFTKIDKNANKFSIKGINRHDTNFRNQIKKVIYG
jgi:hypothetical protein